MMTVTSRHPRSVWDNRFHSKARTRAARAGTTRKSLKTTARTLGMVRTPSIELKPGSGSANPTAVSRDPIDDETRYVPRAPREEIHTSHGEAAAKTIAANPATR